MVKKELQIQHYIDTIIRKRGSFSNNHPELLSEWNYDRNTLSPQEVTPHSGKKVWWKCGNCGFEWESSVAHRADGRGCPKCALAKNRKALISYYASKGSLLDERPDIAAEWNSKRNGDLLPSNVSWSSKQKVWWKCSRCGNEWQSTVANRVNGNGCPKCAHAYQTSEPEQAVLYYVKRYFPDTINEWHPSFLGRKSVDIFIPSLNVAIEYDGGVWHKDLNRDLQKACDLEQHGVTLIRIREDHAPVIDDGSIQIVSHKTTADLSVIDEPIRQLFIILNEQFDLDIVPDICTERDYPEIVNSIRERKEERSFIQIAPYLIQEWDYERNSIPPELVAAGSNKRVWWKCKNGHHWQAVVHSRVEGVGCPYCAGKRAIPGETDIATKAPFMLAIWDYSKNTYSPTNLSPGSNKKVSWKCPDCGFTWVKNPSSQSNNGCPKCNAVRRLIPGYNDLATLFPELMKEWDFQKNTDDPRTVTRKTNKKYWWKCRVCGFEWESSVHNRTAGQGCPRCGQQSRNKKRMKRVVNIDTGEEFDSINEAAAFYGVSPSGISSCIKGRIKTVKGFHWRLAN